MTQRTSADRVRLVYLGNDAGYFVTHRLALARAAAGEGYDTHAMLPAKTVLPDKKLDELTGTLSVRQVNVHVIPYERSGMHPLRELKSIVALWRAYRRLAPDMVHHLTIKPVLYGGLVSRLMGIRIRIHALLGLGYLFFDDSLKTRIVRALLRPVFKFALGGRGNTILVQNPDDLRTLRERGLITQSQADHAVLIPGSGANPADYNPDVRPAEPPIVLFGGRLTYAKGLHVFVEAATLARSRRCQARFVVCGGIDTSNPGHVSEDEMLKWVRDGTVEWWGYQSDMPETLAMASLVVMPSLYGEGIPKILIEAAAAGRAIVTTDTPGCREIVRHLDNGLLIPERDAKALSNAIVELLGEPELRTRMGKAGRRIVEREFTLEHVISITLAVYRDALAAQ